MNLLYSQFLDNGVILVTEKTPQGLDDMRSKTLERLRNLVPSGRILTEDLGQYAADVRGYVQGAAVCVVMPGSTQEVSDVVRFLNEENIAFVPQGGNTGLCAGAVPTRDAPVVLSLARMARIDAPDRSNLSIRVEAGALLSEIRRAAADAGLLFPLSIGAEGSCQIGGNIATNAGGHNVLRYGMTRDLVLGLEVVLPNGRIWNGLRALRKDNTGYDLKQLFIGSEGTLGIVTRAVLALAPAETRSETALIALPDAGAAITLLDRVQASCAGLVSAFEYMSGTAIRAALTNVPGQSCPFQDIPEHAVLVETGLPPILPPAFSLLEALLEPAFEDGLIEDAVLATSEAQRDALWQLRENVVEGLRIEGGLIAHDITVPTSAIPDFLNTCDAALAEHFPGCRPAPFGHLGDGNLHYNIQFPAGTDLSAFLASRGAVNQLVYDQVQDANGSFSAEHGVGQLKIAEMLRYKDPLELELMETLRAALDPRGACNPGKVVPR